MAPDPIVPVVTEAPTVTDWIQAGVSVVSVIATIAAAVLGYLARRSGQRAEQKGRDAEQRGQQVEQAGREAIAWALDLSNDEVNKRLRSEGKTVWQITSESRNIRQFTNTGTTDVELVEVKDVTRPGEQGAAMLLPGYEGTYVSPGNGFQVLVERSMADPAVSKVEVTWKEGPRTVTQVYAVS